MIARSRPLPPLLSVTAVVLLTLSALVFEALAAESGTDAAPSTTKPEAPQPSFLEPLNADESATVLGRKVVGSNGEDLGLITDLIVDRDGQPRAAVIDFGGFLGVGSRKVAVDWNLLQFEPERDHKVGLALDRREIQGAPEYKANAASGKMVGPPWMGPRGGGRRRRMSARTASGPCGIRTRAEGDFAPKHRYRRPRAGAAARRVIGPYAF